MDATRTLKSMNSVGAVIVCGWVPGNRLKKVSTIATDFTERERYSVSGNGKGRKRCFERW